MAEIQAAPALLDQNLARARELVAWKRDGVLSEADYQIAYRALVGGAEQGLRCRCGAAAVIGRTCAACTPVASVMQAAKEARPIVDLSWCSTPEKLITAVMAALERTGREKPAGRFAERAEHAPGMNALCMLAREYVRLENLLEMGAR